MVFYIVNDLNFVKRFCIDQVHKMCWIIVYDFITSFGYLTHIPGNGPAGLGFVTNFEVIRVKDSQTAFCIE